MYPRRLGRRARRIGQPAGGAPRVQAFVAPDDRAAHDAFPDREQGFRREALAVAVRDRERRRLVLQTEREPRQDLPAEVARADPVPGEPQPVVRGPARQRAEERQMQSRHVDRPAPRGLQRDVVERGEPAAEVADERRGGRVVEPVARRVGAVAGDTEARAAERDPSVARRAQVVERGPHVVDALAAGPAHRLEALGGGGAHHDERAAHEQRSPELAEASRPGVQRDDRASRRDHAARRLGRRPAGVEPDDGRALEDPDAAFDERVAEPPREPGRVDGRGMGDPEARSERRASRSGRGARPRTSAGTRRRAPAARPPPRSREPRRRAPGSSTRRGRPTARTRRRRRASSHHAPISSIDRAAISTVRRPVAP